MEQLLDDVAADSANGRGSGSGGEDGYQEPDVEYHNFDEETLLQIEQNDRRIEGLFVTWYEGDFAITDWQRQLGSLIGGHSHLKALEIVGMPSSEGFQEFCQGLVHNRSIEHLGLQSYDLMNVDVFQIISPFFEHNSNLRSIDFSDCGMVGWSTRSLTSALSKFDKCSLRRIKLEGYEMGDDAASDIIEALDQQGNLEYLSLAANKIGLKSCVALARLLKESTLKLQELDLGRNTDIDDECITILANCLAANNSIKNLGLDGLNGIEKNHSITSKGWGAFSTILCHPMCSLENLRLDCNVIDDEGAAALGDAFAANKTLKYLNLCETYPNTGKGWRAFSLCLGNPDSALEELHLWNCNIGDEEANGIASALANNTTLKTLGMSNNQSITSRGWRTFFGLLLKSVFSLEWLSIPHNNIDDEGVATLVDVLANNSSVKILYISGNRSISAAGVQLFTNHFRRPDFALKELYLDGNVNDEVLIDFANSLANNTSLEKLGFVRCQSKVTGRGWGALSTVLCDKSSIDKTYSSNHTLRDVHADSDPSSCVASSLEMNENDNKSEVARHKILEHHFSDGNANIHLFSDMEMKTIPRAISWIGRDQLGFSLLYHLVRSMPTLIEYETKLVGGKRKYGCSDNEKLRID